MGVILAIFLILTVPAFYIIGLIVTVRWILRGGRTPAERTRRDIAWDIQTYSMTKDGHERDQVQHIAGVIARGLKLSSASPAVPMSKTAQSAPKDSKLSGSDHKDWTQTDITAGLKTMDNVNLLLYLGAFLIVVSAGIFVGYNFVTLSGVFKTVFLGLFAAAFYLVGLYLYQKMPKLRPAGSTFTGIGLVLTPLVGAAAYHFTSAHQHGPALWFITSLVSLLLYAVTLTLTRQTYVAYFMAFTTLSLFESMVSLVGAPLYWYGWAMGVGSLVLLGANRVKHLWEDDSSSLMVTANIFVPLSLLFSVVQSTNSGLQQLGVTFGITCVFYLVMAFRQAKTSYGVVYWCAALASLPTAIGFVLWDNTPHAQIAALLVVVAFCYLALAYVPHKDIPALWRRALALVAGLLPFAAALVELYHPAGLLYSLIGALVITATLAQRLKDPTLLLLSVTSALALPYVFLRQYTAPALSDSNLAITYLALSAVLVYYRHGLRTWSESSQAVGAAGYLVAMLFAIIAAGLSGSLPLLWTGLTIALGLSYVSVLEDAPELIYVAAAAAAIGLAQLVPLASWPPAATAVILLLLGLALYGLGYALPDNKHSRALRMAGIGLPFAGAARALAGVSSVTSSYALATGGLLLTAEATKRRLSTWQEIGAAVVIASFNWYLFAQNFTNAEVQFLPWAAFFAVLAWRRRRLPRDRYDHLVIFALCALTLPIAALALASNGSYYGLELILIALALAVFGNQIKYKLLTYWGLAAFVAEVLYQLRSVIFALPKYLISALLGLALLAAAIIVLQRRKSD